MLTRWDHELFYFLIGDFELGQPVNLTSLTEVSKDELAGSFRNDPDWMKSKDEKNKSIEDYKNNFKFEKMYEGENVTF